jgi:K+-sensing histidine kinase KdpD
MGIALLIAVVAAAVLAIRERSWRRSAAALSAELDRVRRELDSVSGLAQDLKGPLQGVIGNTELIIASGDSSPETVDDLRHIQVSAEKAAGIIRSMTARSDTSTLARGWQDVNEIVSRALDGCRHELTATGVRVDFVKADRLPLVYVDGRQLEQVISMLLSRPTPRSSPRRETAALTLATKRQSDDRLIIELDDRTAAIADDVGWSDNLAACRRVVEEHGGSLDFEKQPRGGYRFLLELPVWTT